MARRQRAPLTTPQRLVGTVMLVMMVLQTPILQFAADYSDGTVRMISLSILEATATSFLRLAPDSPGMQAAMKYVLLPGTWFKAAARQADACFFSTFKLLNPCTPSKLGDLQALMAQADCTSLMEVLGEQLGNWRTLAQAGATLAVLASLLAPFVDGTVALLMGFPLVVYSFCKVGCAPIFVTLAFTTLQVAAYIVAGINRAQPAATGVAKKHK